MVSIFAMFVLNPNGAPCLQSLLCGQSLDVASALPVLEPLSQAGSVGLSVRALCSARLGRHEEALEQLLRRSPGAAVLYAQHELKGDTQVSCHAYSLAFGVFPKLKCCVYRWTLDGSHSLAFRQSKLLSLHSTSSLMF